MTAAPPPPAAQPTRTQNAVGVAAFLIALALAAFALFRHELTLGMLIACFVFAGAGMWIVAAPLMQGYAGAMREVAPVLSMRPGVAAEVAVGPQPAERRAEPARTVVASTVVAVDAAGASDAA